MSGAVKADIREQVGIAVNAEHLDPFCRQHETALDRVGALGAAALAVQLGADRQNLTIAGTYVAPDVRDMQDRIAGELGALLWRIKYGMQEDLIPRAVELLRGYMMFRSMFAEIEPNVRPLIIEPFAPAVLHEWLSDRCARCGGTGILERAGAGGRLVRGRGTMQRNAVYQACDTCHGRKRSPANHVARARALGIPKRWYFDAGWPSRFARGRAWLDQLARRIQRPLTQELGRRIRRPTPRAGG
jgi:hypothetical protein